MAALTFLLFSPSVFAASFGLAPPSITNANLKPGSDFVYVVDLNTNDPSEDRLVEAIIQGDDEVRKWVSIPDKNLVMPAGEPHVPLNIQVKVPHDARSGRYRGRIAIEVTPKNKGSEAIALRLGGNITLDLTVTNEDIVDYRIHSISVDEMKVGEPLKAQLKIENLGNQPVKNVDTKMDIFEADSSNKIATRNASQLSHAIPAHVTGNAQLKFSFPQLKHGRYKGVVTSLKDGEVVYENQYSILVYDPSFKNTAARALAVQATSQDSNALKEERQVIPSLFQFLTHPLVIGFIFLLIVLVVLLAIRRR